MRSVENAGKTADHRSVVVENRCGNGCEVGLKRPNGDAATGFAESIHPTAKICPVVTQARLGNGRATAQVITQQPVLFWGLITSMFVGNVLLVLLNLPLVGIWVKLISVPYRYLYPAILVFCVIGLYSIQNQTFEIMTAAVFGFIGYLFMRMKCEPAPLLLGFILGPMLESNLKRALLLAKGDATTFVTRPVSAALLLVAALLLATVILPQFRRKREEVFTEEA
ncbi:Tripartite tricarboxylate transporter TctA family protein [Ensifer sp. YR511]|nr:Tripartite tricarboxylate transporter TctA family protein [Ensifer sp. YR511]